MGLDPLPERQSHGAGRPPRFYATTVTPFTSGAASSASGAGGSAEPASRVRRWRIHPPVVPAAGAPLPGRCQTAASTIRAASCRVDADDGTPV
jgi:hypothetical protein